MEPRAQAAVEARSGDCRGSRHLAEGAPMEVEDFRNGSESLLGSWTEIETPSIVEVRPPAAGPLGPQSSRGGTEVSGGAQA